MLYESHHIPPVSRRVFLRRLGGHFVASAVLVAGSLALGMAGYAHFEHLAWRDAFLNASMLLGGMGPVEMPTSPGGKVFAGLYALYAGLVFLVAVGVLLVPVLHRMLHKFHWKTEGDGGGNEGGRNKKG
jgi:hypothetical protein